MKLEVTLVVSVLFLVLVSVPAVGAQGAALEGIHISEVNVTPENPGVGETVTVTAIIKNDGNTRFDLSQVRLMGVEGPPSISNLGTVAPDSEIEVPLSTTFDTEGTKEFRVRASGTTGGIGTVYQSVTVNVGSRSTYVETSSEKAVVGTWVPLDVEVSNGADSDIHNVRVSAEGGVQVKESEAFLPQVAPNETQTVELLVMSDSVREEVVDVSVSYDNPNGNTVTVTDEEVLNFVEGSAEVELTASATEDGVEVTLLNRGDASVQDVLVEGEDNVTPVEVEGVRGRSSETVELNVTGVQEETTLELSASYDVGDERRTKTTTVGYSPRSDVRLTGTSVSGGATLTVTGSASNVGVEDAQGVLLTVVDTENVDPTQPQSDYFVGTVPASDFGTFELNARVTGETDSIPVRVSYNAGGERHERTVEVEYDGASAFGDTGRGPSSEAPPVSGPDKDTSNEGSPPTLLVVALIVGVVAVMTYGWRKRNGEEE